MNCIGKQLEKHREKLGKEAKRIPIGAPLDEHIRKLLKEIRDSDALRVSHGERCDQCK